ncbi:myotubularin-related protein 11 isoform X7 [Poecile atricapillus]|uniref:myotubularin-related protein 11 isoform X7 n=1 Tax=Poecile atricapillus TaxID=48891 RepID=UPI00273985AA|nr:myotubularin-related protein 11 isoform X7 [Poecile atricapillus]
MSGAPGGRRPTFPGLPGRAGAGTGVWGRLGALGAPDPVSVPAGERVLEEAAGARQRCGNGGGSVPGTLLCTNRRLAFLPGQAPGSRGLLHSEDEVALPCIHKLVAASSFSKPKVLTAASTLKFIPEELAVFCRDFRLLHFYFPENGLAPQAFRVANAIAQAREAAEWEGDAAEGHDGWSCPGEATPEEDEDEEDEEEGSSTMLLFESLWDWEKELQRLGTAGWRVSTVNERFDMAPSLPQYLWVPSGLLDHDLKQTFAHFQERRVPRLCWHHPGGGDLLRAASFHPASEPGSEDVRCLEALLLGDRGPCILADTAELPTLADIQLAHLRLRALCLPGAVAEEKWLSALEGTRWLDHVRTCLRKAVEVVLLLAGKRCSVVLQEPSDRDLNCLLASLVQLLGDPHARSLPGFQSLVQREWVAAGHPFPRRLGLLCRDAPREEILASLRLFSWRSTTAASAPTSALSASAASASGAAAACPSSPARPTGPWGAGRTLGGTGEAPAPAPSPRSGPGGGATPGSSRSNSGTLWDPRLLLSPWPQARLETPARRGDPGWC